MARLSRPNLIVAIDPGLYGAAVVVTDTPKWQMIAFATWDYRKSKGVKRREISPRIHSSLAYLARLVPSATPVVIEDTSALPEQGVSSTHNFGMSRASAETVFLAAGCRLVPVSPNLWKRQMGLSKDKSLSLRLASPFLGYPRLRKSDANLAEATLLAVWYAFRLAHLRIAPHEKAKFGLLS